MAQISTIEYNLNNIIIGDSFRMIKSNIINEEGISSISDLKEYQDSYFQIDGRKLDHSEQIAYCKKNMEINPYTPEDLDFVDIQKIHLLCYKHFLYCQFHLHLLLIFAFL